MDKQFPETAVEYCRGVGPARAELLKKELDIYTFSDLVTYYPFRYFDKSKFFKVSEINSDAVYIQLKGYIRSFSISGRGRSERLTARFADESGEMDMIWFNGIKWIREKLFPDRPYVVFGKPAYFNSKIYIPHPEIETVEKTENSLLPVKLQPIYYSSEKIKKKGLDSKGISKIIMNLITDERYCFPENLTEKIISDYRFMPRSEALIQIHFPENQQKLQKATARLKFEELFFIQLRLLMQKHYRSVKIKGLVFEQVGDIFNEFYEKFLPFTLTEAQKRVIREIRRDMGSGKQMNRLLQGDVGSGKTLVALMNMLIALDNSYQACLMAPTEILANQHYNTLTCFLQGMNIEVRLLTGSVKSKMRIEILQGIAENKVHILVGTHAIIEDSVKFHKLGLAVIDEQHRFGVAQRARLWKKGDVPPHILVMTATPIPRTLAMTLYGDLDVSVIDELPPGRKPVKTMHFKDSMRLKVIGFMKDQIRQGRQIYVVFPLINESEALDLKYLMDGYDSIANDFPLPHYAVSMVHGQMKSTERDREMKRFLTKETQIMVATTVIEVGVDIPNASVMIIENAERFGLSQLHQLRGRVGRGADQSYCILMSGDKLSNEAKQRLQTMVETTDGFAIAEADLKLRGPGDIEGLQQSGIVDLRIADIIRDEKILKYARQAAADLIAEDPSLSDVKNYPVLLYIRNIHKRKGNWSLIS